MMWEAARDKIIDNGSKIEMAVKAIKYLYNKTDKKWHVTIKNKNNDEKVIISDIVICSAPMRDVGIAIYPELKCLEDVKKLNYRDYITVAVLIDQKKIFDDNWIYIHEEKVKAGRIKIICIVIFNGPERRKSCLGLEYFCNKNDKFWNNSDSDLKKIALEDLKLLKLIDTNRIIDFFVVRQEKAYQYTTIIIEILLKKYQMKLKMITIISICRQKWNAQIQQSRSFYDDFNINS